MCRVISWWLRINSPYAGNRFGMQSTLQISQDGLKKDCDENLLTCPFDSKSSGPTRVYS